MGRHGLRGLLSLALFAVTVPFAAAAEITVVGRVLTPDGTPMADAQVFLTPMTGEVDLVRLLLDGRSPDPAARSRTSAKGAFQLIAPKAGMWVVRVEAAGFLPIEQRLEPLYDDRDLPDAIVQPDRGLTIRVSSRDGHPLGNAVVRLIRSSSRFGSDSSEWTIATAIVKTGSDGQAKLPASGGDASLITVSAPGFSPQERRNLRGTSATFMLEPASAAPVEVRSSEGAAERGALIVDADTGHPLGFTDEEGRGSVACPARGERRVRAVTSDGRRGETRVRPPGKERPSSIRLTLAGAENLVGRVIDRESRQPIEGAVVWRPSDTTRFAVSDATGAFTLRVPEESSVDLAAAAPGFLRQPFGSYPARRADGRGATIALEPAAAIEGVVVDASGRPVVGAEVFLRERPKTGDVRILIGGPRERPRAVSSPTGRFRLAEVDPKQDYDLLAKAAGWAPARQIVQGLEPRRTTSDVRVELAPGRRIRGRALDRQGVGIGGVQAALRAVKKPGGRFAGMDLESDEQTHEFETVSTPDGRFEIGDLPAGKFDLTLKRAGFAARTQSSIEVASDGGPLELGDITLEPGERIQGRVVDPSGKPIEGAEVAVVPAGRPSFAFRGGPPRKPDAVSGADGWFAIEDRRGGERVTLAFSREGYLTAREGDIEVPRREVLTVTLRPSSKVGGRVVDPDRKPIAGAQVGLVRTQGGGIGGEMIRIVMRDSDTTDSEGRFLFKDVEPGRVSLDAEAPRFQQAKLEAVEVPEGKDLAGIEIPLKAGAIVEGRVLAPDGRPAVGAEVGKLRAEGEIVRFAGNVTDGDGFYRIVGLSPGRLSIEAKHEDYLRTVRDIDAKPGVNTLDIQLEGGQEVSGRVTDLAGAPLAGARIHLRSSERRWGGSVESTTADGTFRLKGVADGAYSLHAEKEGFAPSSGDTKVQVESAPVAGIEVRMRPGAAITGKIIGLEPEKLAQLDIRAWSGQGERHTAVADRQGNYRVEDLGPDRWTVTAMHAPSGQQAQGETVIEPGALEASLDLRFDEGLRLSGRVVQGDRPIKNAVLHASGQDINQEVWSQTDGAGNFTMQVHEPGNYLVQVRQWDTGLFHEERIEIRASREVVIKVPAARVAGQVLDGTDRQPLAGVQVSLAAPEGENRPAFFEERATTTDLEGRFEIANIADGTWKLAAAKSGYATSVSTATVQNGRGPDSLSIVLDPTEGLSLELRLPTGRPPDEAQVAVLDPSGRSIVVGTFSTGENGRLRLSTVPPGSWDVLVRAGGSGTLALAASAPGAPLPVVLPPSSEIRVVVPDLAGSTVAASAKVVGANGRPFRSLEWFGEPRSDWRLMGGEGRIDGVPPGSWTVLVTAVDGRTWSGSAATAPNATTSIELK